MWRAEDYRDSTINPNDPKDPSAMDDIHAAMIYEFVMANRFDHIIEAGCWQGFSTSAFVEAMRDGKRFKLTCIDSSVTEKLRKIVSVLGSDAEIIQGNSLEILPKITTWRNTLVSIDDCHDVPHVKKEWACIEQYFPAVIVHDCGLHGGIDGPQWLRAELQRRQWKIFVDEKKHNGMMTHRGIMFASPHELKMPSPRE